MPEPQQNANNELNQEIRINLIAARVLLAAAVLDLLLLLLTQMNLFPVSRGTMFAVLIPVFFLLLAAAVVFSASVKRNRSVIVEQEAEAQKTERLSMELELAKTIQSNMLPNTYPVFPERKEFDVYARTEPAKEIGGDYFDFQMIDKDHLALIIADVAGKGIPAAMFMMASKIIIHNMAKSRNHDPAKILKAVNKQIGANNHADMFVTLWLGILEISTGKILAANAGHEYPAIIHPDGQAELIKDQHGFVLGGMEDMKYKEYELVMERGAKLFLYTDGVPEATDHDNGLFGTERMLEALNASKAESPESLLKGVRLAVDKFVNGAEQFDDITMLGLEYIGERK